MTIKKPKPKEFRIYSFVTSETYEQLQALVDENQSTLSQVIRTAILNYLKENNNNN